MIAIFVRQLLVLLLSLFILSTLTFSLTQFFPQEVNLFNSASIFQSANIIESYLNYIANIFSGNWGQSRISGNNVLNEFLVHFPASLELALTAMFLSLVIGLPLGIYAAQNKNKWQDKLVVSSTLIGYSMPIFWWGMLLVLLFSLTIGVTPVASRIGFEYDIVPITGFMLIDTLLSDQPYAIEAFYDAIRHLILPTIVLSTIPVAIFTRVTRSAMIDALASDYIRTAKAKGLPLSRIVWLHALRNALIPIVTVIGLQISVLITGALLTETIFSWPGVGKWLLEAVYRRDLVTIHGGLLAIACVVILTNVAVEFVTFIIDPKLRHRK